MMKRVRKPAPQSGKSVVPQHSQFASRPFALKAEEHEAPEGEPRVSFSLADIDIFPRETVQPKLRLGPAGDRYEQEQDKSVPNRTGMPDSLKAGIESLSGIDMSDVRVHANSPKPARLDALAYTQGNQIYLGPGQERHLPHEAWHAVQQKQGRVRATGQFQVVWVNDNAGLEGEADGMGCKAQQMNKIDNGSKGLSNSSGNLGNNGIAQRVLHGNVDPATGVRHDFESYILFYLNNYIAGLPVGHGIALPAHGAVPTAIPAVPTWMPAILAARILDTRNPRVPAYPDPFYGHPSTVLNVPVAGGAAVPGIPGLPGLLGGGVQLSEMDAIRAFVVFASGAPGIGAGVSPGGQNNSVINWGALHQGFGTKVEAILCSGGEPKGSEPSLLGYPSAWYWMGRRKRADGTTLYAAGHLLHNLLGGPGLDYNLVPLTNDSSGAFGANNANLAHRQEVEAALLGAYQDMHGVGAGGAQYHSSELSGNCQLYSRCPA